jgi:hypothetical protein
MQGRFSRGGHVILLKRMRMCCTIFSRHTGACATLICRGHALETSNALLLHRRAQIRPIQMPLTPRELPVVSIIVYINGCVVSPIRRETLLAVLTFGYP